MEIKVLREELVLQIGRDMEELEYTYQGYVDRETKEYFTGIGYYAFEDGTVSSYLHFKNGKIDGEVAEFYADYQLKEQYEMKEDYKHGRDRFWNQEGVLLFEGIFEYGIVREYQMWTKEGELMEEKKGFTKEEKEEAEKRRKRLGFH